MVPFRLDFVAVFDFICLLVNIDPVELWGIVHDCRDEPFSLPAPVVLWVFHEVASERMGGRFIKLEAVFGGDVNEQLGKILVHESRYKKSKQMSEKWRTLLFLNTTKPPSICAFLDDLLEQFTIKFDFCPRCFSFAFFFCPCLTASVVPMMAGHAAMAVKRPRTISSFGAMM